MVDHTASVRAHITRSYAEWTALSALRSGSPVKKGALIYPALRRVAFDELFDANRGRITSEEFAAWHRAAVAQLEAALGADGLCTGWATKLVNVYLKTRAYVAGAGRPGLLDHLHPPLDGGLWRGLAARFLKHSPVRRLTHGRATMRINDITSYEAYETIIEGCRLAARDLGCRLIEVDQLWDGTAAGTAAKADMPREDSIGCAILLWDADQGAEVLGTVTQYLSPDQWTVRLADPNGTDVYLGAGAQSRLGRWHVTRAVDGRFALPDDYRRRHPHQEDVSYGAWVSGIAEAGPPRD
jgi:hypothetical protein